MKNQLLDKGLQDAVFDPRDGRVIAGDEMRRLCQALATMEEAIIALERRGISLKTHGERIDLNTSRLPVFHVFFDRQEFWFAHRADLDAFLEAEEKKGGGEIAMSDAAAGEASKTNGSHSRVHITELHEVRTINSGLKELEAFGFGFDALIPQERTGSEESRYVLRRGDAENGVEDLRGLVAAVRSAGERGLQVTRFKGLGEMNAEELRETTLDPQARTLVQVSMRDAGAADEMFRVLMGDKVEPRREFIEKHALEVKNLDV
jgi:DNA gyrase subunit B